MNAQDSILSHLISNHGAKRHPFKQVVHLLEDRVWVIDVFVEALCTLLAKAEEFINISILVVTSEKEDLSRVLKFKSQKKAHYFETLTTSVDIVP